MVTIFKAIQVPAKSRGYSGERDRQCSVRDRPDEEQIYKHKLPSVVEENIRMPCERVTSSASVEWSDCFSEDVTIKLKFRDQKGFSHVRRAKKAIAGRAEVMLKIRSVCH